MFGKSDLERSILDATSKLRDILKYPFGTLKGTPLEDYIKSTSRHQAEIVVGKAFVEEPCDVTTEDFELLLDYLGIEIKDGKRIVKKKKGKK